MAWAQGSPPEAPPPAEPATGSAPAAPTAADTEAAAPADASAEAEAEAATTDTASETESAEEVAGPEEVPAFTPTGMDTNADAGQLPVDPAGGVGGSEDSPIKPSDEPVPAGDVVLAGGGPAGASFTLDFTGLVHLDMAWFITDSGGYDTSFRVREAEIGLRAAYDDVVALVIDLNLGVDSTPNAFKTSNIDELLVDQMLEQAYGEWTPGMFTLRVGKMNATMGNEALDAHERMPLTRSHTAIRATPDLYTGIYTGVTEPFFEGLDFYIVAINGWDVTLDNNRSKTFGAGLPHRFGKRSDGSHLYQGSLDFLVGAERQGENDLRWIVDYSGGVVLSDFWELTLEIAYAQEAGIGFRRSTGARDPRLSATWYAGRLAAVWDAAETGVDALAGGRVGLRVEYVRDADLNIDLPRRGGLPCQSDLFGITPTIRYEVFDGLEAGLEYKVEFEQGNINNVCVQRNVDAFPEFWKLGDWFVTQEIQAALLGSF